MEHVICSGTEGRALEALQKNILTSIARGYALEDVMRDLCTSVENIAPGAICSVLKIDEQFQLQTVAAPSLPLSYSTAIDGLRVGPCVGSCGTAAFTGRPVEVRDIATDPLWADYKKMALPLGLRACWSSPIIAKSRVVGTFAFYFDTPRGPNDVEKSAVSTCVHLCAIALEQAEFRQKINDLAFHDQLTRLGNRSMLKERIGSILEDAELNDQTVAILYIDLDGFKAVNDLHGQSAGDRLLVCVAERLRALATEAELIVRLGGDEFLIVARETRSSRRQTLAGKLATGLRDRYEVHDTIEIVIGASIGIATYPNDGTELETLLAHADTALHRVKDRSPGGFAFFEPAMEAEQAQRRAMERDISLAVELNQLSMVYQPVVSAETGMICSFEALVRWNHSAHGEVGPDVFIPAAERCGAIKRIGEFALWQACYEAATWNASVRVAVNISPAQVVLTDFAGLVEQVLLQTGLPPWRLELEVTESLFIRDSDSALRTLRRLRDAGILITLDDFGTGYSSLSTLRSFPFDHLKIDRQFVRGMNRNSDDAAIVESILAMAHAMNLKVVAEGVEGMDQLAQLRALRCDYVQGYLLGRPSPIKNYSTKRPDDLLRILPLKGPLMGQLA